MTTPAPPAPAWTRDLYRALEEYRGTNVFADLLEPWMKASRDELAAGHLAVLREPYSSSPPRQAWPVEDRLVDASWELYALSRVADVLLLGQQPEARPDAVATTDDHHEPVPMVVEVSLDDTVAFFEGLGLRVRAESRFHPFFHEIVQVIEDESAEAAPRIEHTHWPCLMLGELMFVRAGVTIRCGRRYASRPWADASTLYWAYRRRYRSTSDLSMGWGHNSQWRTCFRRDYACPDRFVFNADGHIGHPYPLSLPEGPTDLLPPESREQLLAHRCLLQAPPPSCTDPWPHDWTLELRE